MESKRIAERLEAMSSIIAVVVFICLAAFGIRKSKRLSRKRRQAQIKPCQQTRAGNSNKRRLKNDSIEDRKT